MGKGRISPLEDHKYITSEQSRSMTTHKLLKSETVLPDNYSMFPNYAYIADNVFIICKFDTEINVSEFKKKTRTKEVRRCEIFGHPDAKLGDRVE